MDFYNEIDYRQKALKYQQKIEKLLNIQEAGVVRAKYLENVKRQKITAPTGLVRSKYLENVRRQQLMIRRLRITTMGGTDIYDNQNVTFDQYQNIRIQDDLLFLQRGPLIRTHHGANHMNYKPYTVFNNDLREIDSTNMKSEFAKMINKDITLNVIFPQPESRYRFNVKVIDVNDNQSNIVINQREISSYDDNTVRNLYREIELQVHTPNFIISVEHPHNNIVIPRTHINHRDIFPIPLNYYPITVVLQ